MASRTDIAERLLARVDTERLLAHADRPTKASDNDLETVAELLAAAAGADAPGQRQALRGRISHVVVDTWSFDAALSEELVAFDDRFLAP